MLNAAGSSIAQGGLVSAYKASATSSRARNSSGRSGVLWSVCDISLAVQSSDGSSHIAVAYLVTCRVRRSVQADVSGTPCPPDLMEMLEQWHKAYGCDRILQIWEKTGHYI